MGGRISAILVNSGYGTQLDVLLLWAFDRTCDVWKFRGNGRPWGSIGDRFYADLTYKGHLTTYSQACNAIDKTFGTAIQQQVIICHKIRTNDKSAHVDNNKAPRETTSKS